MRKETIGVIGLGYVGAPLSYLAASKGYKVIGVDVDEQKISDMKEEIMLPSQIKNEFENNSENLIVTSDYNMLKNAEIIVVCVPTPTINDKPDLSILEQVSESLALVVKKNCLLIIESTIAPGMTKKYIQERLYKANNLVLNKDYELAYCPERIDPGNKKFWVGNINRVCGAAKESTLNKACKFYKSIVDAKIIPMSSIEETELVKVWENSTRNVNIALSNLLAKISDKYDFSVKNVIEGLNSKTEQFGLSIAFPGIGPGGHCIPEDIHYLIDTIEGQNNIDMQIFKEAVKINENMPKYALNKFIFKLNDNNDKISDLNVLFLGISYKSNSKDLRRSQALVLLKLMQKKEFNITVFDPLVEGLSMHEAREELYSQLEKCNAIVLGCGHDLFLSINFNDFKNIKYVLDCWNKIDKNKLDSQITYIGIGE